MTLAEALDPSRTLHLIGDVHVGAIHPDRLDAVIADVCSDELPVPAAHVQVGDLTDRALPDQDQAAIEWLGRLPGPVVRVVGNHDVMGRSPEDWAAAHGMPSPRYTVDLGFARLIVLAQAESVMWPLGLGEGGLAWLDEQLASTDQDCLVVCHAPPAGTVGGDVAVHFTSNHDGFGLADTEQVAAVLDAHPNAKMWISGHTHSPLGVPGLAGPWSVGDRDVVAVNCSCIYYTGRHTPESIKPDVPLMTLYLTYPGDRVDLRFRDHWSRSWLDDDALSIPLT